MAIRIPPATSGIYRDAARARARYEAEVDGVSYEEAYALVVARYERRRAEMERER